ncbi:MAG: HlyD family efflux transporter periplasmic adaptor subunit [Deltaproteobacteria bacterium]|nr:HlyD family efflux transporter periplasmic adaptor subunit [Deltaproteobacteria bacterium]
MLRWIKRIFLGLVLLAIGAVIVWAMLPQPVPIEVATVARGPLAVTVDEDGRARVEDRHVIAAPLAGALARIELRPGDAVDVDAVVARVAPLPSPLLDARTRVELEGRYQVAEAHQRLADATVGRARVHVDYADKQLAQGQGLAGSSAISGDELDRRALALDVARRELQSARFAAAVAAKEVETASAMLERYDRSVGGAAPAGTAEEVTVRSPVKGRVLRVFAESEGVVGVGTPLVEVGDPSRLEVVAEVLTADAVAITPGAPVTIEGWGGPTLNGKVRLVEPSAKTRVSALGVEEQRVSVIVDLVDPPEAWASLGDGWRIEVRIATWRADDVVRVPLGALFRSGERWAVYVVDGEVAHLRTIDIDHRNASFAEVEGGLAPGDVVIVHPSARVREGAKVVVR